MFQVSSKRIFLFCETLERLCGHGFFIWKVTKPVSHEASFDVYETCKEIFDKLNCAEKEQLFCIELESTNHFLSFNGTHEDVAFRKWIPQFPRGLLENDNNSIDDKIIEIAEIFVKHFKQDHNEYYVFVKIDHDLSDKEGLLVAQIMSKMINLTGYHRDSEGTDWFKVENSYTPVPFVMSLQDRCYTNDVWLSLHLTNGFKSRLQDETSPNKRYPVPKNLKSLFQEWSSLDDTTDDTQNKL